jgi:alkaline phosphatase
MRWLKEAHEGRRFWPVARKLESQEQKGHAMRIWRLSAVLAGLLSLWAAPIAEGGQAGARNIILMIADGTGFNAIKAADYYDGNAAVYESFPVKYAVSTYSADNDFVGNPLGYDPARAWSSFTYVKSNATDSASAATAMNTGAKIHDGQVNWSTDGGPLTTIAQIADGLGKATGAVTTVPISHATPACVYAHNSSRDNYADIANEMIYTSGLDVILGAGHPYYTNNGAYTSTPNTAKNQGINVAGGYVGGLTTWSDLTDADGANGFTCIETRGQFENVAAGHGPDGTGDVPAKLLGVAQVATTLQQARSGGDVQQVQSGTQNTNVPSLATMASAALNVLGRNANGLFLMIEGGAVDSANHSNQKGRMIEEVMDFNAAVQAALDWVDLPGDDNTWDNTLLVVTADHETGHLWGPTAGEFNDLVDNGDDVMPGMRFNSTGHTNSLVPLYAKGTGAGLFAAYATGSDNDPNWGRGPYLDNTDIFKVMNAVVPEPAALTVLLVGGAFLLHRRRG